jgi:hypothetical protein
VVLCRDIYHCTPGELDRQDWSRIQAHVEVLAAEAQVRTMNTPKTPPPGGRKKRA